jgi:putative ABC transport system permease protein
VVLDGKPVTVVGVMPPGFLSPDSADTGVWMPDAIVPVAANPRLVSLVSVIGRLKPGVTLEQARANLEWIARGMDREYPAPWSTYRAAASVRIVALQEQLTSSSRMAIKVLMGAVFFILLIVCANLANLFLARSLEREKEISIRMAIGASRARIVRLLLTETMLFALVAGCVSLIFLYWASSALRFLVPAVVSGHVAVDLNVFEFAAICSILTGFLFGVLPSLTASRTQPGPRNSRLRQGLVVAQLALSVVLLIGAGLMLRTFLLVLSLNPGFDPHNILLADVSLAPLETYTPARQTEFFDRALANLHRIPGVERVAATSASPLAPFNDIAAGLHAEGEPETSETICMTSASPDYFRLLSIPILEGRAFNDNDRPGSPHVAIINRTLALVLFKDRDPLGRRVQLGENSWATVVGIVGDIRHRALDDKIWPELFQPYTQAPSAWMSLLIRTTVDPSAIAPAMRSAIRAIDPTQPVFNMQSMETRLNRSLSQRRQRAFLIGAMAPLAFLIAAIGVYATVAYSAVRRTHEIGIRVAVGAKPTDVLNLIVSEGVRLAIAGVGLGTIAAFGLTRFLSSLLYEIHPRDSATFIVVSLLLLAAATIASLIPAMRATRIDPLTALREQ